MVGVQLESVDGARHGVASTLRLLHDVVDFGPVDLIGYRAIDYQDGVVDLSIISLSSVLRDSGKRPPEF